MTQYRIFKNNQFNNFFVEHKWWYFWFSEIEADGHGGHKPKAFMTLKAAEQYCEEMLQPREEKPLIEVVKYIPEKIEFNAWPRTK